MYARLIAVTCTGDEFGVQQSLFPKCFRHEMFYIRLYNMSCVLGNIFFIDKPLRARKKKKKSMMFEYRSNT